MVHFETIKCFTCTNSYKIIIKIGKLSIPVFHVCLFRDKLLLLWECNLVVNGLFELVFDLVERFGGNFVFNVLRLMLVIKNSTSLPPKSVVRSCPIMIFLNYLPQIPLANRPIKRSSSACWALFSASKALTFLINLLP